MQLEGPRAEGPIHEARVRAMPTVLEYGDLVGGMKPGSALASEFELCQRLVAAEAVHNSMVATCQALSLLREPETEGDADGDRAFEDVSQPLEAIAVCLANFRAFLLANPQLADERQQRLLRATFVVEFGLEHGLPELCDPTSEAMLGDFLERVREWGGRDTEADEVVRRMVLSSLPPAKSASLHRKALDWFENNQHAAIVGGVLIGGAAIGMLVAGLGIGAAALARQRSR